MIILPRTTPRQGLFGVAGTDRAAIEHARSTKWSCRGMRYPPKIARSKSRGASLDPYEPEKLGRQEFGSGASDLSPLSARLLAVVSYAIVAGVCLARLDGLFTFRDLPWADTAIYYRNSSRWLGRGLLTVDRGPLYVVVLAAARTVIDDAAIVVPAHRLIAALVLALATLAFLRRLFPSPIALVLATWAAIVPTQFDGLYEIHLVGAAACAVTAWAATYGERRGARVLVLGLLLIFSLIRSELLAAAFVWGAACALYERSLWRSNSAAARRGSFLLPYVIPPLVLVLVLSTTFAAGEWTPRVASRPKTARHFCDAYALGVAEREGLPPRETWQHCGRILARDFGRADVGPLQALAASPQAVFRHFAWNLRLLPATLESMLWGGTGAAQGTDYVPVATGSRAARAASLGLVVLLVVGFLRRSPSTAPRLGAQRRWGLVGLGALLTTSFGVLLFSRARPPYLAPLGIAAFALVGRALEALWPAARSRWMELAVVGIVSCAVPFVPAHYDPTYSTPHVGAGQPTALAVRRLDPHRNELALSATRLAWALRANDLCYYLSSAAGICDGVRIDTLLGTDDPAALDRELRRLGTTHLYVDERTPGHAAQKLESAGLGWTRVAPSDRSKRWVLLHSVSQ
jgi:hypothetical protein